MNTRADARAKWILYKELELIPDTWEEPKLSHVNLRNWLTQTWNLIIDWVAGNPEPKIWSTIDKTGAICWHIYDPVSHESACFSSESEVIDWMERRYYRSDTASPYPGVNEPWRNW
ncbi:MAG: hypothetical protein SFY66_20310 [Oculatellaceae cyanobacterium bins.114]|nr:hypothetical protein [Oculatellaceae cyanobacterium bins.114]